MTRNERLQRRFERKLLNDEEYRNERKRRQVMYEYEKAFQPLPERGASQHLVSAEDINLVIALKTLVEAGTIVGQHEMLTADTYYFLNPERENPALQIQGLDGRPKYLLPPDRLNRPTQLRNGVTQCITVSDGQLERTQLENVRAELKKIV